MNDKPLYIISIVSDMLGLHPQTLRQYERLGLVSPSRTIGNTRLYSDEDLDRLRFIIALTKDMGVNLAGVEVILRMKKQIEDLHQQMDDMVTYIRKNVSEQHQREQNAVMPAQPRQVIKVKIERE